MIKIFIKKRVLINSLIISILLLFSACNEKIYKNMYDTNYNMFNGHIQTNSEINVQSIQNGENPSKRPSYNEYRGK